MEKQSILNEKHLSFLFISFILLFTVNSCKQEHVGTLEEAPLSIYQLKDWFNQTFTPINQKSFSASPSETENQCQISSGDKMKRLMRFINWDSYSLHKANGKWYVLVDLDDRLIAFENGLTGSRKLVFSKNLTNDIQINIIEFASKAKASNYKSFHYFIDYYFHSKNNHVGVANGIFILYDKNYFRIGSSKVNNGNFYKSNSVINKNQNNRQSAIDFSTSENACALWGYFLVTYDQYGNVLEKELLYTFYVGDCDGSSDEEEMPEEYGGGENENLEEEFNKYTAITVSPTVANSQITEGNNNSVTGIIPWTVARATFGFWQILAEAKYSYTHNAYFNATDLTITHNYTFSEFLTTKSFFVGSHMVIESSWNQSSILNEILNNGSSSAKGKSRVTGTVRHKAKFKIPGTDISPEIENYVQGNTLEFYPH